MTTTDEITEPDGIRVEDMTAHDPLGALAILPRSISHNRIDAAHLCPVRS